MVSNGDLLGHFTACFFVSADLGVSKVCAQHLSNILCVRKVQGSIHLIQDVDGSRFEQQHGQDERQGHQ